MADSDNSRVVGLTSATEDLKNGLMQMLQGIELITRGLAAAEEGSRGIIEMEEQFNNQQQYIESLVEQQRKLQEGIQRRLKVVEEGQISAVETVSEMERRLQASMLLKQRYLEEAVLGNNQQFETTMREKQRNLEEMEEKQRHLVADIENRLRQLEEAMKEKKKDHETLVDGWNLTDFDDQPGECVEHTAATSTSAPRRKGVFGWIRDISGVKREMTDVPLSQTEEKGSVELRLASLEAMMLSSSPRAEINSIESRLVALEKRNRSEEAASTSTSLTAVEPEKTPSKETPGKCSVESRVAALETSLSKALNYMMPKVEALISQVEKSGMMSTDLNKSENKHSIDVSTSSDNLNNSHFKESSPLRTTDLSKNAHVSSFTSSGTDTGVTPSVGVVSPPTIGASSSTPGVSSSVGIVSSWKALVGKTTIVSSYDDEKELRNAANSGRIDDMVDILESGVDVNATNSNDRTALHCAVLNGHEECVSMLLEHGADVNCTDNCESTPLHYAADEDYEDIVVILLNAGADINATNDSGQTPFNLTSDPDIKQLLRRNRRR